MTENPVNPPAAKPVKWYYLMPSVLVALIVLGPFAFPLLWKSPQYNLFWKITLTVIFTVATIYMIIATWKIYMMLIQEFRNAGLM